MSRWDDYVCMILCPCSCHFPPRDSSAVSTTPLHRKICSYDYIFETEREETMCVTSARKALAHTHLLLQHLSAMPRHVLAWHNLTAGKQQAVEPVDVTQPCGKVKESDDVDQRI